jgi:DNA-3-methyladenine glycosylase I
LMGNARIIRNRLKIEATILNARLFLEVQAEFGTFDRFIWQFTGGKPLVNAIKTQAELPAFTAESDAMSRELRRRGFKFVGSTICYAHMQATGMVNDHLTSCFRYQQVGQ